MLGVPAWRSGGCWCRHPPRLKHETLFAAVSPALPHLRAAIAHARACLAARCCGAPRLRDSRGSMHGGLWALDIAIEGAPLNIAPSGV